MASKRYDLTEADFDARYSRWIAALESGNEAELLEATVALPTLSRRVLDQLYVAGTDIEDQVMRATEKRLIVLLSEIRAHEAARRREQRKAAQRRRDRTTRIERTVELPTKCARCGGKLEDVKATGRPRIYCSPACRKAAYEDRRAHRDGAVQVQVVERCVTEVRERVVEVPHRRIDCIKAVLADDDAMIRVIWTLTVLVRDPSRKAYNRDHPRFKNLRHHAKGLCEALDYRAKSGHQST